jgi:hypothetical protein
MIQVSSGECSNHAPGAECFGARCLISRSPRWMPKSLAVRPRPAGGVASHITVATTIISIAIDTKLCHRKIVLRKGMRPPGTSPPCETMSRI